MLIMQPIVIQVHTRNMAETDVMCQ